MGLMWLTGFLIFQNKNDFCIHFNFAYVEIRRLGIDFFFNYVSPCYGCDKELWNDD